MNKLIYQLSYLFNLTPWNPDEIALEITETLDAFQLTKGHALDVGCGTGAHSFFLAEQGWQVIGIDYVKSAIKQARKQATHRGSTLDFHVGDITKLSSMTLPTFNLVLDIKCSHGLSAEGRRQYVEGLKSVIEPDGLILIEALYPRKDMGVRFGLSFEEVKATFTPHFNLLKNKQLENSGWYWFHPK